jgi:pyruvate-ferredoxin/flavodoxin oxidoreductase
MEPLAAQRPTAEEIWEFTRSAISCKPMDDRKLTVKTSQFLHPYNEFSGACAGCGETPYVKLVTQLYGDRMMIINPAGCSHGWAVGAPAVSYGTDAQGHGPTWNASLFENTAEYSYGVLMSVNYERERAVAIAEKIRTEGVHGELGEALTDWLAGVADSAGTRARADRLAKALAPVRGQNPLYGQLHDLREYFMKRSIWAFGGDGWAYDIGYGGLDHVLSFGQDINVLVYDTEVYSNTGGQASKATPTGAIVQFAAAGKKVRKKDLGMMAIAYGNIYVAQVGMGADRAHTLKAIREAEAYPGMSMVICYAPCISHGIQGGMAMSQEQTRRAVEAGYWHLWRYNPLLREEGKNPFIMDSKPPSVPLKDFLITEVRYSALYRKFPDRADALLAEAQKYAQARYQTYMQLLK